MSVIPPADLLLVPEPKSKTSENERQLLSKVEAKRAEAKAAVQKRKNAEKAMYFSQEKHDKWDQKKELRELQKAELKKPVIDHQHNGVWDTEADKRNDASIDGTLTADAIARAKAQKAMDRRIQREREESEAFKRECDLKEQRRVEKADRDLREKIRLKIVADRKAEKDEARRVKAEMEARSKDILAREACAIQDKLQDALRERKIVLAKQAADDEYDRNRFAEWKRDMHNKRELDNVREQREKKEAEDEERERRREQLEEWKERERLRKEEEAKALARSKAARQQFHARSREKAIQDEILRLQKKLDAEHMMTSAAEYRAQQAAKNAKALSNWAHNLDHEVKTIRKESKVKLW